MINRSYSRRHEMVSYAAAGFAAVFCISLLAGAVVVIVHFVVKFW